MIRRGPLLMVGSATSFSLMAVAVKFGADSIPHQEMIAVRSLFIIAIVLPTVRSNLRSLLGVNRPVLLMRGLFGYVAMSCYFYTLSALPVADAMVLQYMSPIFTILWAILFLGERLSNSVIPAALLCLAGLFLVVRPTGEGDLLVGAIALAGAALAGGAYAAVRQLRTTDNANTIIFWFPLVSLPLSLGFSVTDWVWPGDMAAWGALLAVCVFSYLGQILLTHALRHDAASRTILVNYLSVGFGILFGILLFDTIPDRTSIVGIVLILLGVSIVSWRRRKGEKKVSSTA